MTDRVPCHVIAIHRAWTDQHGRQRGSCVSCGYEGYIRPSGGLYPHSRDVDEPKQVSITRYDPLYTDQALEGLVKVCMECGAVVFDVDAHDDWHFSVVESLGALQKQQERQPS